MYKILITFIISTGLSMGLYASSHTQVEHTRNTTPISMKKINRMDSKYNKHKAVKRDFKTKKEFQHRATKKRMHQKYKRQNNHYDNGHRYYPNNHYKHYRYNRQRGYRHSKRGWYLAYRYDRASFYDNEGFYYGYFNRHGYYFEDIFYRYDRYYSYKDRVRGRGLFDHRYYMPVDAGYYGFCRTQTNHGNTYKY